MQKLQRLENNSPPRWGIWVGALAMMLVLAVLFWATWKGQFAAPPGYLFNTPSQPVEAGYCLAVAQAIAPQGLPIRGFVPEVADFWVKRLRSYGGNLGGAIAAGQAALGRDLATTGVIENAYLSNALEACSLRAINYGYHFRTIP